MKKQATQKSIVRSQAGFSIMQAMIASALLVGVFGVLFHFGGINQARMANEADRACDQIAQSSLDNLRSLGFEADSAVVNVVTNGKTPNTLSMPATSEIKTVSKTLLWQNSKGKPINLVDGSTNPATTNNYMRSLGVMNALAGIYNSNLGVYCRSADGGAYSAGGSAPPLLVQSEGVDPNKKGRLDKLSTTLSIQRYNLKTGAADCTAFYPRPAGTNVDETRLRHPTSANVSADYGFLVKVTTSYTSATGKKETGKCSVSSLFQYPRLPASAALDNLTPQLDWQTGASNSTCDRTMVGATLKVTLPAQAKDRAWVPMCMDTSVPGLASGNSGCPGGIRAESFSLPGHYVPCESVTACGVAPSKVTRAVAGSGVETITLTYPTLKWGCSPKVEARLYDSALNTGATVSRDTLLPWPYPTCGRCPAGYKPGNYCANGGLTPKAAGCEVIGCDPETQPAPHWGMRAGTCLRSCGALAGITAVASSEPCANNGMTDAGVAYDVPYCCLPGPKKPVRPCIPDGHDRGCIVVTGPDDPPGGDGGKVDGGDYGGGGGSAASDGDDG